MADIAHDSLRRKRGIITVVSSSERPGAQAENADRDENENARDGAGGAPPCHVERGDARDGVGLIGEVTQSLTAAVKRNGFHGERVPGSQPARRSAAFSAAFLPLDVSSPPVPYIFAWRFFSLRRDVIRDGGVAEKTKVCRSSICEGRRFTSTPAPSPSTMPRSTTSALPPFYPFHRVSRRMYRPPRRARSPPRFFQHLGVSGVAFAAPRGETGFAGAWGASR